MASRPRPCLSITSFLSIALALGVQGCGSSDPLRDWGTQSLRQGVSLGLASDFASPVLRAREVATAGAPDEPHETQRFTLEDAINRALIANRGLQDASDRELGAVLSLMQANSIFELKVRPRVTTGVNIGEDGNSFERLGLGVALEQRLETGGFVRVSPGIDRIDEAYRTGADLSITQPLLRGAGRLSATSSIAQAEFSQRAARRSAHQTRVNIVLQVVSVFHASLRQRDVLALEESGLERVRAHREATRAKHTLGMAESVDVSRAELQVRQVEDTVRVAREGLIDGLDELRLLLKLPQDAPIELVGDLAFTPLGIDEDRAAEHALRYRVEVAQAEDSLLDAHRSVKLADHNTLPELNLGVSYSVFGFEDRFADSTSLDRSSVGISLSTSTDLARTSERLAAAQSRITLRGAGRSLERVREDVGRQARREVRALQRATARIESQQSQIGVATGKLELARLRFSRGMAGNFDLIEAEGELRRAEGGLVQAVAEHALAGFRLRAAMGSLIAPPDLPDVPVWVGVLEPRDPTLAPPEGGP